MRKTIFQNCLNSVHFLQNIFVNELPTEGICNKPLHIEVFLVHYFDILWAHNLLGFLTDYFFKWAIPGLFFI